MLNLHSGLDTAMVATGDPFAVATIVGTTGSTPHPIGTSMLIHADGSTTSSLSGGCVEGAVHAAALEALEDGHPRREHYGYSPTDAFAVGLTCGGEIDVHIAPFAPDSSMHDVLDLLATFHATDPVALIRRIDVGFLRIGAGPQPGAPRSSRPRRTPGPRWSAKPPARWPQRCASSSLRADARASWALRARGLPVSTTTIELLVESRLSPPRMIVFGANTFAEELLKLAPMLGYQGTLCDPRAAFTLQPRFNTAEEISTAVAARVPGGRDRRGAHRFAHGAVHPDARPQVRHPPADPRAAPTRCLHWCHGFPKQPRGTHDRPARGTGSRAGTGPAALTDRA